MKNTMPQQKTKRYPMRGGAFVGEVIRQEKPFTKSQVSSNKSGHGAPLKPKRGLLATGRPGTPNGVCLGPELISRGALCECGKHHVAGRIINVA